MSFSQALLPEFDEEMKNTRKVLERVPDGKFDYKPHEKSMPLGRLASHVVELPSWTAAVLDEEILELQPGMQPYVAASQAALLEKFDKAAAEGHAKIAATPDAEWQKTWTLKFDGKPIMSMPRIAVVRSVILNHLIHHRAQLGVYLRLNNVEIPGMYGPSADEPQWWQPSTATQHAAS